MEEFVIPKHAGRPVLGEADTFACISATDVLDDLGDNDALFITEDDTYERCEALARNFLKLPAHQRAQAVDLLSANLGMACSSAHALLSASSDAPSSAAALRHRSGIKMMVHLLHLIAVQAEREADQPGRGGENAAAAAAKQAKGAGRGRKAAAAAADDAGVWDWQQHRLRVLAAAQDVMRLDLKALFRGLPAAERLVNVCMELALHVLASPATLKQDAAWPACRDILVRGAVAYDQLDFVAAALMEAARKHEHVPPLAAQAAKHAEEAHNSTQLAAKLLGEFWALSPDDYDAAYATNAGSVRLAGELVVGLAELLPKVVSNHISQLRPYLACGKAHCLRGALLAATGSVLVQVFPTEALSSSLGAGAAQAHLRSKEALLALLHTRVLDKAAYVRQKVLQTWARLVEESCVPLSHWNTLLAQAIGRLEDESQLVVKAALQLLSKMVHQGIFQPPLRAQVYVNTLRQAEVELAVLQPKGQAKRRGGIGEGIGEPGGSSSDEEEDEDGGEGGGEPQQPGGADGGAAWEQGGLKIEGDAQDGAADGAADAPDGGNDDGADADDPAAAADAAAVTRLRTMIASLKEGASFCNRLTASLTQVQALLASPAAAVVHDAIVFLTMCKTYEVEGAAKALRGMWPLVFSKHEPVRQSVLDSWHILHLHDRDAKAQLEELLQHVVPGCSLSELTALQTILSTLAAQGKLAGPKLVKLLMHDVCHYFIKLQAVPRSGSGSGATMAPAAGSQPPAGAGDEAMADAAAANGDDGGEAAAAPPPAVPRGPTDAAGLSRADYIEQLRRCFALLSLLTAAQPDVLQQEFVCVLLEVGLSSDVADAWVARHTCLCLRHAAPHLVQQPTSAGGGADAALTALSAEVHRDALAGVARLLLAPPPASMEPNWPSAAEAAVAALYALSPRPQELMASVLEEMFARCRPAAGGGAAGDPAVLGYSAAALSRFFFVLGRTALQHLLHMEQLGKAIRAARLAASRAAAEAAEKARDAATAASKPGGKRGAAASKAAAAAAAAAAADDVGSMLGAGALTADAELDDLCDLVESQIMTRDQLLGRYGGLLSSLAHLRAFVAPSFPPGLQAAAMLALTQLMAVDARFCNDNIALLFTLLYKRLVPAPVRVNLVVSLADLASRWPNVLEPWTAYVYEPLADPDPAVKLAALSSLTHLVLGGMVKAKGNVAKVAVLLVDDCPELVDRAVLFFEALAASGSGGSGRGAGAGGSAAAGASASNPVYNLLPDCLSVLLAKADPPLRDEQLSVIMSQLLGYVKDKQAEALRERLVARLQLGGPREWRLVAWCIGQLGYSEKGLRRVMELAGCYRHALGEQAVFDVLMGLADKARKATGGAKGAGAAAGGGGSDVSASQAVAVAGGLPGDFRGAVEEWVAALQEAREAALEAAAVEAMPAASEQQQQQSQAAADEAAAGEQLPDAAAADGAQPEASAASAEQQQAEEDARQQIVLVQSQDLAGQDDSDAAVLEAAAAAAASGLQRLSLAQRAGRSARTGGGAATRTGAGAGAAATRTGRSAGSRAAAAPAATAQRRRRTAAAPASPADSNASDAIEDGSSSDDEAAAPAPAVAPAAAQRATRGRRAAAAAPVPAAGRPAQRGGCNGGGGDSSSEDDD